MKAAFFSLIIVLQFFLTTKPAIALTCAEGGPCQCGDAGPCDVIAGNCPGECLPLQSVQNICQCAKYPQIGILISSLLPYIFVIAGLILFGLLISNGYTFLTSGGDPKKAEMAKGGVTSALVGFIIIIAAYWLTQIIQFILRINILGGP